MQLEKYWNDIPVGKENAVEYATLCKMWDMRERAVRTILHKLSFRDNGDDYVLIRSSKTKGFYRTDDAQEIDLYRKECLSKGRSIFAPVNKCNRILAEKAAGYTQDNVFVNIKSIRLAKGIKQSELCKQMKPLFPYFDEPMLSKIESGMVLPTQIQLSRIARILGVEADELISYQLYPQANKTPV